MIGKQALEHNGDVIKNGRVMKKIVADIDSVGFHILFAVNGLFRLDKHIVYTGVEKTPISWGEWQNLVLMLL